MKKHTVEVSRSKNGHGVLARPWLAAVKPLEEPVRAVAIEVAAAPPPVAANITLEQRLVYTIGSHQRVLLAGQDLESVGEELTAAGCQVALAATPTPDLRPARQQHRQKGAIATIRQESTALARLPRYDVIAMHRLLECAADPVSLLARFRRQLTRNGRIVAVVPNVTHATVRLRFLAGQAPADWRASEDGIIRFLDAHAIRRLFERAGFKSVRIERHTEGFDDAASALTTPLPPELIGQLTRDTEAMTSAFLISACAFPLTGRASLELRLHELAEMQQQQRLAIEELRRPHADRIGRDPLEAFNARLEALSGQIVDVKGLVDGWRDGMQLASQSTLRTARETIAARAAEVVRIDADLQRLQYDQLVQRVAAAIEASIPARSIVLVVSKGDPQLTRLHRRVGWHFLQTADGVYAGHHPASSSAAIEALERLRAKGAAYLVVPQTAFWWFEHYADFKRHLDNRFQAVARDDRSCVIYALTSRSRS